MDQSLRRYKTGPNLKFLEDIVDRSKIVAIIAGAVSVILAVAYLLLVMLLDFRGEMQPAPQSLIPGSGDCFPVALQHGNENEFFKKISLE